MGFARLINGLERKQKLGLLGGGVAAVLALALLVLAPAGAQHAGGASCPSTVTDVLARCEDTVERADAFTWEVTTAGTYEVTVRAGKRKVPFDPGLEVQDASGVVLAQVAGGVGRDAVAKVNVKPGEYTVKVFPADDFKVKGGYAYELEIAADSGPP